jgi:hypothetical protein
MILTGKVLYTCGIDEVMMPVVGLVDDALLVVKILRNNSASKKFLYSLTFL